MARFAPVRVEVKMMEVLVVRETIAALTAERDAALARLSALEAKDWRWFGCAGHFIAGSRCRFHLHTRVGNYRISTIGEMVIPGRDGFEEVGLGRLYETMVFRVEDGDEDGCPGEGHVSDWSEVAGDGYNTWQDAHRGHLAMCERFAILTRDEGGEDAG